MHVEELPDHMLKFDADIVTEAISWYAKVFITGLMRLGANIIVML